MTRLFNLAITLVFAALLLPGAVAVTQAESGAQPHEKFLYVACVNVGGEDPDFLAVIGVDPRDASTYGKLVHRVDMLQRQVARVAEEAANSGEDPATTFYRIKELTVVAIFGRSTVAQPRYRRRSVRPPHLTEAWFC